MRKNWIAAALAALTLVAGCSGTAANQTDDAAQSTGTESSIAASDSVTEEGETEEAFVMTDAAQYITIGEYTGLTTTAVLAEVTDEDVETQLQNWISQYASLEEVTDRTDVQEGDTVNITFVGKLDGVEFDGGSGTTDLQIGSGAFIDGFEDGLIGAENGETLDVNATFPDPYSPNSDLSGKEAVFTVTVNSISESVIPELTDEFVQSNTDYDTIDEYREYILQNLKDAAEAEYESARQTELMRSIQENSTFLEYPEQKMEEYREYWNSYVQYLAYMYGYSDLETFKTDQGITDEDIETISESSCEAYLIYSMIAQNENITASDAEVEEALAEYAEQEGMTGEEYLSTYGITDEDIRFDLISGKVLDWLLENND